MSAWLITLLRLEVMSEFFVIMSAGVFLCVCVCACVCMLHAHVFCPLSALTPQHFALLKQDQLNECQEDVLSYMQARCSSLRLK